MPKRRTKTGRNASLPESLERESAQPAAKPAPKPRLPWWKDPPKLAGLAMVILVVVELGVGSHLPPRIAGYLNPLILFVGVLAVVLSLMRRWENR